MTGERKASGGPPFEEVVVSIRRWLLGLGLAGLLALLVVGVARSVVLGYLVGFLLSLFSLDHLAAKARRVERGALDPGAAKATFAAHFLVRWTLTVAVIVIAAKAGANPIAAVAALLLLQAAIVCRSIGDLLMGSGTSAEADDDGEPDPGTVE